MSLTMKYKVRRFKSLKVAIKELEPFIRNGAHLQTGKPLKQFGGLRSRELLANWLLCVVSNFANKTDQMTFTSDPLGGDGIICDSMMGKTWPMEHILVPTAHSSKAEIETLILNAIAIKQNKGGTPYASGKTLVVFLNAGGGEWFPNKVAKNLPDNLYFESVWVVCLQSEKIGAYIYGVTLLDLSQGNTPIWLVRIGKYFNSWDVDKVQ